MRATKCCADGSEIFFILGVGLIVEKILGNLSDFEDLKGFHLEKIYINSDDSLKKILRLKSDHDREFGLSLDKNSPNLQDGDIIFKDDKSIVAIFIKTQKVLKIAPKNMQEMGELAHFLGNRHLPIQLENDCILMQYDRLIESELAQKNIAFEAIFIKLQNAFKHQSHSH